MSDETKDAILNKIQGNCDNGDHVQFIFQGGEPTIVGLSFFENFINNVSKWEKDIKVSYALQTNGLIIDED